MPSPSDLSALCASVVNAFPALRALCATSVPSAVQSFSEPADWPSLRAAAARHKLTPVLSNFPNPPQEVEAHLHHHTLKALQQTAALQQVFAAFESAGVPALTFKGPALAALAYGNVALRDFCDLDLYVPPTRVHNAIAALQEIGYNYQRPLSANVQRADYELTLINHRQVQIDLHWRFSPPYLWNFDDAGALDRSIEVRLTPDQPPIRTLCPEDHLLYLAIHAAKDCWSTLRSVTDPAALIFRCAPTAHEPAPNLRRGYSPAIPSVAGSSPALYQGTTSVVPTVDKDQSGFSPCAACGESHAALPSASCLLPSLDWPLLTALAKASGSARPLAITLHLAKSLCNAPVPDTILSELDQGDPAIPKLVQSAVANVTAETPVTMDTFRGALFHIRLAEGVAAKLRTFKRRLLDPNQADTDWLRLPKSLRFLYPAFRPFRLAKTYLLGRPSSAPSAAGPGTLPSHF